MGNITAYIILIVAVALGTAANGFAKGAQGFTVLLPSVLRTTFLLETSLFKGVSFLSSTNWSILFFIKFPKIIEIDQI